MSGQWKIKAWGGGMHKILHADGSEVAIVFDEKEVNLIKAAPKLLAATKALLEHVTMKQAAIGNSQQRRAIKRAIDAIKMAESK